MPPSDPQPQPSLADLVTAIRTHSGLAGKRVIEAVHRFVETSDPLRGPGDDGAAIPMSDGRSVIACGEALHAPFVAADPYGAGVAAVLANVNDIAAMGAVPLGIVNTVMASASIAAEALRGMADAAALYDVPIVGGHLSEHDGEPALSAFAVGEAGETLSVTRAAEGQDLVFACCLEGRMRADFPFFTTLGPQGPRLAADIRLPAEAARAGLAVSARDVSMAGLIGSLAMLLEYGRLGTEVDLDRLPVPAGVALGQWLVAFPSYAFWLTTNRAEDCVALFRAAGLTAAVTGRVTGDGVIALRRGAETRLVIDLSRETVTGLWPRSAPA